MQDVRQLVRIRHGSHLYGTSTPTSDQDFKGVHLPSGRNIILGRAEDHINRNVVAKAEGTDKNTADAIDDESFSVQKFFDMLMKGDTVATEILFAPTPDYGTQPGFFQDRGWAEVQAVGKQLLNRQCKGFVGYCVRQAAKYGIKGSRMSAVKRVIDFLEPMKASTEKLSTIEFRMHNEFINLEHTMWHNLPTPSGADLWHFEVCDRKMPMTASIKDAYNVWLKVWENYGERARAAMTNEGIDWKAVSHAVRVAQQAIELLSTGTITFPRPNAGYLLAVKQGKLPYSDVSQQLETLVQMVQRESEASVLPEKSDRALADALVERLYLEQIK